MMKKIIALIIVLFSLSPIVAQTQKDSLFQCKLCVDGVHPNENPYNLSLKKEIPFIAAGIGFFGTGILLSNNNNTVPYTVTELNALDRNNINGFDRVATRNNSITAQNASNYFAYSSFAIPLLFLSEHYTRSDFLNLFVMGLEVGSINIGVTDITKNLVNRPRPYTYNASFSLDVRRDSQSKLSFFSGHTSITTAYSVFFAKVITDYHPNMKKGYKISIWGFATLVPATTAYLRVAAGKHYPTDVITGFAIGAIVGWLVPELHKKRNKSKFTLTSFNYRGVNGLTLNWKL